MVEVKLLANVEEYVYICVVVCTCASWHTELGILINCILRGKSLLGKCRYGYLVST